VVERGSRCVVKSPLRAWKGEFGSEVNPQIRLAE